jgi:hypothetical protein
VYKKINASDEASASLPFQIDASATKESENLRNGVQGGIGDGT